jgi:iron complex transport system substrate-binding protein
MNRDPDGPFRRSLLRTLVAFGLAGAVLAAVAAIGMDQARAAPPSPARPASAPARPQRIVSLLPSLTESVCALGDCDRLVGVDRWSDWPERVRALPALGGQDDPQVERLVALKPDLVLLSPSTRAVDRLQSLGLHVVALEARDLGDTHRVLEAVARALGRPGEGDALWRATDARLTAAASRVPAAWKGRRAYVEIGSEPYAAGEGSYIGQVLARLGLGNIVPASMGPFPQINPEFVVRAQPDLIVIEAQDAAAMAARPAWSTLHALQGRDVCALPPNVWYALVRPGPRIAEAAEHVADCIAKLPPPAPGAAPGAGSRPAPTSR